MELVFLFRYPGHRFSSQSLGGSEQTPYTFFLSPPSNSSNRRTPSFTGYRVLEARMLPDEENIMSRSALSPEASLDSGSFLCFVERITVFYRCTSASGFSRMLEAGPWINAYEFNPHYGRPASRSVAMPGPPQATSVVRPQSSDMVRVANIRKTVPELCSGKFLQFRGCLSASCPFLLLSSLPLSVPRFPLQLQLSSSRCSAPELWESSPLVVFCVLPPRGQVVLPDADEIPIYPLTTASPCGVILMRIIRRFPRARTLTPLTITRQWMARSVTNDVTVVFASNVPASDVCANFFPLIADTLRDPLKARYG